jgi:hypothetical protein
MPAAVKYVTPLDPEREALNTQSTQELQRRGNAYKEAVRYYIGNQDEQLKATDPLDPNDNTTINMVKMTGDRTVQFLFPEIPKFETDPESIDDTDEEIYLRKCFEANGGLAFLTKLGLRGFLAGHTFIRVKPNLGKGKYPRMVLIDPATVTVFWKADDVGEVLWYEQRYVVGADFYIQDFIRSEDETRWFTRLFVAKGGNSAILDGYPTNHGTYFIQNNILEMRSLPFEEVGAPVIHTSPIAPIIEFRHLPHPDDYYGLGEFTQKDLQDVINRIASERNRIVRENSDPVDVITGADVDDVDGDGGIMTIANANARVSRLEMKGDLSGITAVLDKLIETYLAIARVVLLKGEAKDLQRVTNASVRTLFLDMLAKNMLLQASYGESLKQICKLLLTMGYANDMVEANPDELDIQIHFGSPLPVDLLEVATINQLAITQGYMSGYTAATRLNLDPKFEQTHTDQEKAKNLENQRAQMQMAAEFQTPPTANEKQPTPKPNVATP